MKSSDSHKAVHAHGKRKNLVLSLVFCVAAVCVALLVLVGPGHSLAAGLRNGSVAFLTMAQADTTWQLATRPPDGILETAVDLFLHRVIIRPA